MFLLEMNVLSDLLKKKKKKHPETVSELCYHHTVKATTLSYLLKWKFTADLKTPSTVCLGLSQIKPVSMNAHSQLVRSGPSSPLPPLLSEHWVTLFYARTHTHTHTAIAEPESRMRWKFFSSLHVQ